MRRNSYGGLKVDNAQEVRAHADLMRAKFTSRVNLLSEAADLVLEICNKRQAEAWEMVFAEEGDLSCEIGLVTKEGDYLDIYLLGSFNRSNLTTSMKSAALVEDFEEEGISLEQLADLINLALDKMLED